MTSLAALDLRLLPLAPRTRLFHLPPIGIGTPLVEGLAGYIMRLAEASSRSPARLASCSPPSLSSRLPNPATSPSRALLNRRPSYIKLIKRCGYGRSGFDLLRIRVLLAS
jgi:hypothetical protein